MDTKDFEWNQEKNSWLKTERDISFEGIVYAIENDGLLDTVEHKNKKKYPDQSVFVVRIEDYVYLVPYVEETDYYFLKTIIPNRKAKALYLKKGSSDET